MCNEESDHVLQSSEGRDEGGRAGQRPAAAWRQERQPGAALLREAHQEPPQPHRRAPAQAAHGITHVTLHYITLHQGWATGGKGATSDPPPHSVRPVDET